MVPIFFHEIYDIENYNLLYFNYLNIKLTNHFIIPCFRLKFWGTVSNQINLKLPRFDKLLDINSFPKYARTDNIYFSTSTKECLYLLKIRETC